MQAMIEFASRGSDHSARLGRGQATACAASLVIVAMFASGGWAQAVQTGLEELLERRAAALRQQVAAVDRSLTAVSTRVPPLERELDRLAREIESVDLAEPEPEKPPEPQATPAPRKVRFRPPLLRTVQLDTPLALVCKNGRVAILDMEAEGAAFEAMTKDQARIDAFLRAGGDTFPAGDFDVRITVIVLGQSVIISEQLVWKTDKPGEPGDEAVRPGSRLTSRLRSLDAAKSAIQFAVYPDSFEEFRAVRSLLWERGFAVNWFPIEHGKDVPLGSGGGGINVQ